MTKRLQPDEIATALDGLDGWRLEDGQLARKFVFADFFEASGFMIRAAIWAERLNHHPEEQNVYRTLFVELVTRDAGGVSALDVELATKMNELA